MWSYFSELQKHHSFSMFGFRPFTKSRISLGPLVIVWISELLAVVKEDIFPLNAFRQQKMYCLNQPIFHRRNYINLQSKMLIFRGKLLK